MSAAETVATSSGDECPLCKDSYTVSSIAPCDHRICFKCSVRLRVVCGVSECPVCRKSADQVIITRFPGPFLSLVRSVGLQKKGFLYTENELMRDVDELLSFKCVYCSAGLVFGSFDELRKHCNKEHRLLFCDFCFDNLKLFPSERKAYTQAGLVDHRRNGDADDKSYRAHPACLFCDKERFFDDDVLYRHMKSEHFSCHLCDASNIFYRDYFELRRHFSVKHYICEEGNCREARFTNAFGNELDLKGHRAAYHANLMTKEELRENAKLDLAVFSRLNLSPNTVRRQTEQANGEPGRETGRSAGERGERISKYERRLREIQKEREALHSDGNESDSNVSRPAHTRRAVNITPAEFPALGIGDSVSPVAAAPSLASAASSGPALNKASSTAGGEGHAVSTADRISLFTRTHNVGKITSNKEEDFPALCSNGSSRAPTSGAWNVTGKNNSSKNTNGSKKSSSAKHRVSSDVNPVKMQANPVITFVSPKPSPVPPVEQINTNAANIINSKSNGDDNSAKKADSKKGDSTSKKKASSSSNSAAAASTSAKSEVEQFPTLSGGKKATATKSDHEQFPPLSGGKATSAFDDEDRYFANLEATPPYAHVQQMEEVKAASSSGKPTPPPGFAAAAKGSSVSNNGDGHKISPLGSKPAPSVAIVQKPNLNSAADFPDLPLAPPKPASSGKKKQPPPGFSIVMPTAKTSSPVEQSATTKPVSPPAPTFPFWRPADYEKRNAALQSAIAKNLNLNSAEEFRVYSRRFRDSVITAFDFLSKCVDLFPKKQLGFIISELIVLLPETRKQRALFDAVSADSLLSTLIPHLLSACAVCGQVVTVRDAALHRTQSHNPAPANNGLPFDDSRPRIDLSNYVVGTAT